MPAIVGWIISGVLWLFRNRIGYLITTILIWLGVSFATNHVLVQPIIDEIQNYVAGMSAEGDIGSMAMAYLRYLQFDKALTMVFSAYVARTAVSGSKVFLAKRV